MPASRLKLGPEPARTLATTSPGFLRRIVSNGDLGEPTSDDARNEADNFIAMRHGLSPASADVFFVELVVVSPTRFQPAIRPIEYGMSTNRSTTRKPKTPLDAGGCDEAAQLLGQLLELVVALQNDVNSFIDRGKSATRSDKGNKQLLGRKDVLLPNAHDGNQFHVALMLNTR